MGGLASALSTALTGLSASETMISVAGNNISNSTTDGFKQSQALFTTQFQQTLSLGTAPSGSGAGEDGGTNPQQIGLGTQVAEITPDFSQGTIQVSSSPSDLAIQGDGFFIVQGAGSQEYTRDGSFQLNAGNQLVTTTGQTLLGYGVDKNFEIEKTTLQPLTIPLGSTAVAQATQNVTLQGDLSPTETVATTPQIIQSQTLSDASVEAPPSPSAVTLTALAPPTQPLPLRRRTPARATSRPALTVMRSRLRMQPAKRARHRRLSARSPPPAQPASTRPST